MGLLQVASDGPALSVLLLQLALVSPYVFLGGADHTKLLVQGPQLVPEKCNEGGVLQVD